MATYNLDQYQKVWRMRAKKLKQAANKSVFRAAMFMESTAKGMSPKKSGDLREGIHREKIKSNVYEVSSSVPGDFPYQFWVNQTAPFRTLHFPKGGWNNKSGDWIRYFKPGTVAVYGDGSHRITGTPRFWHLATLRTSKLFVDIAKKNISDVFKR